MVSKKLLDIRFRGHGFLSRNLRNTLELSCDVPKPVIFLDFSPVTEEQLASCFEGCVLLQFLHIFLWYLVELLIEMAFFVRSANNSHWIAASMVILFSCHWMTAPIVTFSSALQGTFSGLYNMRIRYQSAETTCFLRKLHRTRGWFDMVQVSALCWTLEAYALPWVVVIYWFSRIIYLKNGGAYQRPPMLLAQKSLTLSTVRSNLVVDTVGGGIEPMGTVVIEPVVLVARKKQCFLEWMKPMGRVEPFKFDSDGFNGWREQSFGADESHLRTCSPLPSHQARLMFSIAGWVFHKLEVRANFLRSFLWLRFHF